MGIPYENGAAVVTVLQSAVDEWLNTGSQTSGDRLRDALYKQVVPIVNNHRPRGVDAEDLVQEVFFRFFQKLDRYDPTQPVEQWVSTMAKNLCLDRLRFHGRRPEWRWTDLSEGEQRVADAALYEKEAPSESAGEARELLEKLFDYVSSPERMILTLFYSGGKSMAEIATMTGQTPQAVKMAACRGRRKMKEALAEMEGTKICDLSTAAT